MKNKGPKAVNKGAPSGFFISILVHAGAFLLAGVLVVFNVVNKEEKKFVPPKPIERPKMKLKKPKVKVKKTAKPKSSNRIVTKVTKANMPDIQLPEMSGIGEGFAGGMAGGFDLGVDLSEVTMFGNSISTGSDLEGTFYDIKRDRAGRRIPVDTSGAEWREILRKFLLNDWSPSTFSRYYRAPKKLYANSMVVPTTLTGIAPSSFGDDEAIGALWMVHYKGQLTHKEGIKFRFWGIGDEFLVVRVGGEIVLGAWWPGPVYRESVLPGIWESSSLDSDKYYMGNEHAVVGDWIELEPGESKEMEILIGDNGGAACFILAVQEEDVKYPRTPQPAPLLPAFKTAELTHDLLDLVYKEFTSNEVDMESGPIFNDYTIATEKSVKTKSTAPPADEEVTPELLEPETTSRLWALSDGRAFEAEFISIMGGKAIFKLGSGKNKRVPLTDLSDEDRLYLELARPPTLDLNFKRNARQETFTMQNTYAVDWWERPPEDKVRFGLRVKKTNSGDYNHELKSEFFAVGIQRTIPDKQFVLLDWQESTFTLTRENGRTHEFQSPREAVLTDFVIKEQPRGEKYYGYLAVVRDLRGEIVAIKASHSWLEEHRENLEKLSVGNYFGKDCVRTFPGRPRAFWK